MNFIGQWFLEDLNICDDIIEYYNRNIQKQEYIEHFFPDETLAKQCKQLHFSPFSEYDKEISEYINQLQIVANKYIQKYPYCDKYSPWGIEEGFQIQHYRTNEGFFPFHAERSGRNAPSCYRHLVFMTYLNDVTDKGETEFYHQNLKIKPEKGKTLIWPADWTHTHRGIPSPTQEKYIITGWFQYLK